MGQRDPRSGTIKTVSSNNSSCMGGSFFIQEVCVHTTSVASIRQMAISEKSRLSEPFHQSLGAVSYQLYLPDGRPMEETLPDGTTFSPAAYKAWMFKETGGGGYQRLRFFLCAPGKNAIKSLNLSYIAARVHYLNH